MNISGNTILITGGGSGIGRGLAQALHSTGNKVIIAGRRPEPLQEVVRANPGMASLVLDVADPASIRTVAERLAHEHPALNVLVNNAGIMRFESVVADSTGTADAEATIATNLLGPIRLTAALLPQLCKQERATVINVTSGLAFVPLAATPSYSATKAALHSYTQSLRFQLRGTPVEVIELAPPLVATDLTPGQRDNPRAMPLEDYVRESMALLALEPTPSEILVERVKWQRHAEARGDHDNVFAMINGAG